MLNLSKEEKIFVIEYAINKLKESTKNFHSEFICSCLRDGIRHYKLFEDTLYFQEVLQQFPEVTEFCPEDKEWDTTFGDAWFPTTVEFNKDRIELLEKSLKLLKDETTKA